jgi:hypothetical protein
MAGGRAAPLVRPGESASSRKCPAAAIPGARAGFPASPSDSGREGKEGALRGAVLPPPESPGAGAAQGLRGAGPSSVQIKPLYE